MGRHKRNRKRKRSQQQTAIAEYKPKYWCYFCEKDYESDEVLTKHQREKHYSCPYCPKKLTATRALLMHGLRVHNIKIDRIPNAIEGRDSTRIELFGMKGAPYEWTQQKAAEQQRLYLQFQQTQQQQLQEDDVNGSGAKEPETQKRRLNQSYTSSFVQVEEDRRLPNPSSTNEVAAEGTKISPNTIPQSKPVNATIYYIWPESESLSMEEKRALHPKYQIHQT